MKTRTALAVALSLLSVAALAHASEGRRGPANQPVGQDARPRIDLVIALDTSGSHAGCSSAAASPWMSERTNGISSRGTSTTS